MSRGRLAAPLTRREFGLGLAAAGVLVGCEPRRVKTPAAAAPETADASSSLKAHAAEKGLYYGCAVDVAALATDVAYAALVKAQAGILVAKDAMQWQALRPSVDTFRWNEADALVAFVEANGMAVRGRCLCWHGQLPRWFAGEVTTANARELLETHIARVAGRYAGRMHSWDVVNEAVRVEDGRPDGLRDSPWLRLAGEDYIELAFKAARDADPEALLTYNEYGLEREDPASYRKRLAVLQLLRRWKARRVPVDALGVEAHLTVGDRFGSGLIELLAAVRQLGLQVYVTELDVDDRAPAADVPARDADVARVYADFLGLVLREPAVKMVMTRLLPFDEAGKPGKAFYAMRAAFDARRVA